MNTMVAVTNTSAIFQILMYTLNQSNIQNDSNLNYYHMKIGRETNPVKCYGFYGCFNLSPPWTSEHRPVSLFPNELVEIQPNYLVYTRKNKEKPILIDMHAFDYSISLGIEPMKPIYVVTHGYMEGGNIHWIYNITQKLLDIEDCNIMVVDWHGGSNPPYMQAVANIRLIGSMTAYLLGDIARYTGDLGLKHVHCIAHALGAHLCGYIGYTLQEEFNLTLGRITGMDPAGPHFEKTSRPVRLDRSAARYVDIIHTDANQFIRGGLGISESIGHVDYYPNGGSNQPGCDKSVFKFQNDEKGNFFKGMIKYLACNQERAYRIFLESINTTCSFMTITCTSYQDFVDGKCWDCGKSGESCIKFGHHGMKHYNKFYNSSMNTSLNQYLLTGSESPYCRGHYRVIVKVSESEESKKHRSEIGQLILTMHSSTDGTGFKSSPVGFVSGYYQPGEIYMKVVATEIIKNLMAVELKWSLNSSVLNPSTWRLFTPSKIYLEKITVESLENQQRITICPESQEPFVTGESKLMIPTNC